MLKSLSARVILSFILLDLLFTPLVAPAVTQLLGIGEYSFTYGIFAALAVVKLGLNSVLMTLVLRPAQRLELANSDSARKQLLLSADRALSAAPLRVTLIYASSWMFLLGVHHAWLRALGTDRVPLASQSSEALAMVVMACVTGASVFAFPLATMLLSDASSRCSSLAQRWQIDLNRPASSLQARIATVALFLAFAPMIWMVALGYIKQVEVDRDQLASKARIAATELARALDQGEDVSPAQQKSIVELAGGSGAQALVLGADGKPSAVSEPLLAAEPEAIRNWLAKHVPTSNASHVSLLAGDQTIAFVRSRSHRVAAVVLHTPPQASSGFVMSALIFSVLVLVWAPLSAYILSRSVAGPVEQLTTVARRVVEQGDLSQLGHIPQARQDELGALTTEFNSLVQMMRDLSRAAQSIAEGDLAVQVEGNGELPDAFREMLGKLREIVEQIQDTSVELASAGAEILAASQEQEAAATAQSSGMEEISRTMDSLSESAAYVFDSVQAVLSNAERTLKNTDEMARRIGELTGHAGRIAEILEVIRDIADKSDLLALNGSLEASRAAEAGRGFALVAAEMRRLAERVTASVQDVKKLVSDIRASGSSTVLATEESRKLADSTTEAARQITFTSRQQKSGTAQVSESVKSIAQVVSQAASATSQTRTSAEGLKIQADRLAELVKRFRQAPREA